MEIIGPLSFFFFIFSPFPDNYMPVSNIPLNIVEIIKPKKCTAYEEKAKYLTTLGSLSKVKTCP